jgi:ataxin-3
VATADIVFVALANPGVDAGYFSVSVLERALEVWGLSLLRWRSEAMREYQSKPEEQLGFVLNLESHWFTIRGFPNGYW